jgi:hypothetical protein
MKRWATLDENRKVSVISKSRPKHLTEKEFKDQGWMEVSDDVYGGDTLGQDNSPVRTPPTQEEIDKKIRKSISSHYNIVLRKGGKFKGQDFPVGTDTIKSLECLRDGYVLANIEPKKFCFRTKDDNVHVFSNSAEVIFLLNEIYILVAQNSVAMYNNIESLKEDYSKEAGWKDGFDLMPDG